MGAAISGVRQLLFDLYSEALRAVEGRRLVRDYLRSRSMSAPVVVVAIGKAAVSMAWGAVDALGGGISRGLVITKRGYCGPSSPFPCLQAGHPIPDAGSLAAGEQLLELISSTSADAQFLFLISGGSSALVELLPEGMSLADLERVNSWLLGSGLDIAAVNTVRKRISRIKGGRLAEVVNGRDALNLMISDVPGDTPATIGSGLLVPDGSTDILEAATLPRWLHELISRSPPLPTASCFRTIENVILAGNRHALEAVAAAASGLGLSIHLHPEPFEGDAVLLGRAFARQVMLGSTGLYLWGGESTVVLPSTPGRGGRNQSLALAAAQQLAGKEGILFLSAGTDGSDGPTEDAGALVDGGTQERGEHAGLAAAECLRRADAGTFLKAAGDLIHTGPTGTNVMDLVLALKVEGEHQMSGVPT